MDGIDLDGPLDQEPAGSQSQTPWPLDDRWLQALPQAVVALDEDGRIVGCNAAASKLLGSPDDELVGRPFVQIALKESERGGFAEVLRLVHAGTAWSGDLLVEQADATARTALSLVPVTSGGDVVGAVLVADRSTGAKDRAVRLSERLTRLAKVVAELLDARDLETVTDIVIEHMADAAGATVASLSLLVDDQTLALLGLRGGREGAASRWATYSVLDDTPASEAVRTRKTLVLIGRDEIRARFPNLETAAAGERSLVCLPLSVGDRCLGVASLSFPGRREIDAAELEFFRVMADTCAQAVDRIHALAAAADQSTKLQFLAEASAELASSLDYESTLRNVAWLAVPRYADWCSIALEQDGVLRTLAVAHLDPAKLAIAEEYLQLYPPDPQADSGSYQVLRTGKSQLTAEITDEMLVAATDDPERLQMLRDLNFHSALVVPLQARGKTLGTMTWVSGEAGRRFGVSDLAFGEDLARRAGTAIDNALLHSELREVAERLQQAVLPADLPRVPGWELGAVYSPSGRTDVGGDFYDAIQLDGNRLAVFVGDVMGRGVQAAASMAQIRASLRTLVAVDPEPRSVMTRLDMLFDRFPTDQLVTLVYVVADAESGQLHIASAGHPPPMLVNPDGTADFVESARGLVLGAGGSEREDVTLPFHIGQTLVMFTDGLLERRTEDFNVGKQRLLDASRRLNDQRLQVGLAELVDVVRDHTREDDLAILAARRTGTPAG